MINFASFKPIFQIKLYEVNWWYLVCEKSILFINSHEYRHISIRKMSLPHCCMAEYSRSKLNNNFA